MSSHNSVNGEIREQLQKLKDMSFKKKVGYIWHYYKVHIIITTFVVIFAASFIHNIVTRKNIVFYAALVNAQTPYIDYLSYGDAFEQYIGLNTGKYRTFFDTASKIYSEYYNQDSAATTDRMAAMIYTGTIDVIVADTYAFEYYAQSDSFANLEDILPQEILEKYSDSLYYTDSDTFVNSNDVSNIEELPNYDTCVINHHSVEDMKKPVPVGIFLSKESNLMETGCYDFLIQNEVTYQGYPSEVILGVPATAGNLDMILKYLEFLETAL